VVLYPEWSSETVTSHRGWPRCGGGKGVCIGRESLRIDGQRSSKRINIGSAVTWPRRRCAVDHAEEEEEDSPLLTRGLQPSVTYQNGMWPGLAARPR
jgi:hypothetical protein